MAELYERLNTTANEGGHDVYGNRQVAQTFTIGATGDNEEHYIYSIKLYVYKSNDEGNAGDLIVKIKAVDANHKPTGTALASGTLPVEDIPLGSPSAEWKEILMSPNAVLSQNTEYAIIIKSPSSTNTDNCINVRTDYDVGYSGGQAWESSDGGNTWTAPEPDMNYDVEFEEWGNPTGAPIAIATGASEISGENARLNGKITDNNNCLNGTMYANFRYKKTSETIWTETGWQGGSYYNGQSFYVDVSGLDEGEEYEYQTKAKCTSLEGQWSNSQTFTAGGTAPTATPSSATSISNYTATLNGQITDIGSCQNGTIKARFRYRIVGNIDWIETDWQNTLSLNDTYNKNISNLLPETTYEFQTQAKGACGIGAWSSSLQFTTSSPTSPVIFTAINQYVEIDFGAEYQIGELRQYGDNNMNGDGEYKLQYWDGSNWQDILTGISTRNASWSDWIKFPAIITTKVRIVAVTLDTYGENRAWEFEIRGGAGGTRKFEGEASDAASITKYGEKFKRYAIGYVNSDAECEEIAEKLLKPDPEEGGKIKIPFTAEDMINELIHFEDDRFGINGDFAVLEQDINFQTRATILQLGFKDDFAITRQRARDGVLSSQEAITLAEGSNAYVDKDDR